MASDPATSQTAMAWLTSWLAPVGVPLFTAFFGYWAAHRRASVDKQISDQRLVVDQATADAAQSDALNRRIEVLMNGYEKRIADLTEEVHHLREEVSKLRTELEKRTRACMHCPWHVDAKDDPDAPKRLATA